MRPSFHFLPAWRAFASRQGVLAALCAGVAVHAAAAGDAPKPSCKDGVCTLNLDAKDSAAPCAGATLLLAWRQAGGATLIQCATDDADMDKPSFAYDRDAPAAPAFPLTGMRFFMSDVLGGGAVSDKFASRGFCQPPKPPRMTAGEILIGEKVPSEDEKNPYCYRALRVGTTSAGVAIRADDGDSPKPEAKHADWDKLAAKMTALIRASNGTPQAAATAPASAGAILVHVVHAKAPLRDSPDAGAAVHGYLVQGDEVTLLDRSKAADGWFKVRYAGKSGKAIERWIRAEAVDASAPATAAAAH
jgi:hypothetical protein